jgi:hypothetical protein
VPGLLISVVQQPGYVCVGQMRTKRSGAPEFSVPGRSQTLRPPLSILPLYDLYQDFRMACLVSASKFRVDEAEIKKKKKKEV